MSVFRQYVAPLLIVLVFLVALVAVSSRIFLSQDMAAPAPIEEMSSQPVSSAEWVSGLPPSLSVLITGLTDESSLLEQF